MGKLGGMVEFISGSPQFRITEVMDKQAPLYTFYSQADLSDDLVGIVSSDSDNKQVRTNDKVNILCARDIVFSLTSGHEGYLYTQNYVKLIPNKNVAPRFLVYLLNEDRMIKKQFMMGLQDSQVLKYTLKQVKELEIPKLPSLEKQRIIGDIYFKQLRLQALKNRAANLETAILLTRLEEGIGK